MELKYGRNRQESGSNVCSNRTFMELKYAWLESIDASLSRSNRTFMELKFLLRVSHPVWHVF